MYRREKITRDDRYKPERKNPSFSSTLLDEIYRSTDDGTAKSPDLKFYRESMQRKQSSKNVVKVNRTVEDQEQTSSLRRVCLIEKWMDKKVSEKSKHLLTDHERKSHHHRHDHDQDVLFFSSTSSSSDSSSGGFSSSDTDSLHGSRSRSSSSCFVPAWPKPVRTSVSAQAEKSKKTDGNLFYEQRQEVQMFDEYKYHYNNSAPKLEESLIKSKSRALKIYGNLKKVKQPISPGGRLASFINSLFTTGNTKKPKNNNPSSLNSSYDYSKSGQVSTCSSTSSFSRSCLSKNSPSTRERLRNGVKRSVRFYPVSVIVDEDCKPCGHKSLYEEEQQDDASLMSVSVPTAWKIGKSQSKKKEEELKFQVKQRSERVNQVAREFLKDYHQNQNKNDKIMRDVRDNYNYVDDEEDDDAASCSSSDLFELDHLSMIDNNRYCEELPVYETTHVDTNRAIASGLIM